jgi:hypothetical protein
MIRATIAAVLAMAVAGCLDTINGFPDPAYQPPAPPPFRCDAGLVPIEQPAPNIPKCVPGGDADAGTD